MERLSLYTLLDTLMFARKEINAEQAERRQRAITVAVFLFSLLAVIISVVISISDIISGLQNRHWSNLVRDLTGILVIFSIPSFIRSNLKSMRERSPFPEKARVLRELLHDETLVPLVAEQPLALEHRQLSAIPLRIGPVRRVKGLSITVAVAGVFFLSMPMLVGLAIINTPLNFWAIAALSIVFFVFALFPIVLLIVAIRIAFASVVVVNERGLSRKWPNLIKGRSITLAWSEITGFYEIRGQEGKNEPSRAYVLTGAARILTWSLPERPTKKEQQASIYLTRLIAARTGLPLRDLTKIVESFLNPSLKEEAIIEEVVANNI